MQRITRDGLRQLRVEINEALKGVAEKHNLTMELGNITFQDAKFTGKIEARIKGTPTREEEKADQEQSDYDLHAGIYQLPKRNVIRVFPDGSKMKPIGWKRKARKNKVIIQDAATQKRYVCPVDYLKDSKPYETTTPSMQRRQI